MYREKLIYSSTATISILVYEYVVGVTKRST